jgi:hypothetical protein
VAGATIKLYLIHGDPRRLRTAELSNWTGKAVAGPRTELDGLLLRDEVSGSGVYLLTGVDAASGRPAIYIGEAECVRDRLRAHLNKDFWSQVVVVVSKDENLTKAHIRYLEGRLIEQAIEAGRMEVQNSQASGSKLPESDREDMEVFLDRIHQLLPVLGTDALVPIAQTTPEGASSEVLYCKIKSLVATGRTSTGGFVVFKGSRAVLIERPSAERRPQGTAVRRRLIEEGILVESDGSFRFVRDTEFSSASAAATVVHGGSANGLTSWKDAEGRTLRELEDARTSSAAGHIASDEVESDD